MTLKNLSHVMSKKAQKFLNSSSESRRRNFLTMKWFLKLLSLRLRVSLLKWLRIAEIKIQGWPQYWKFFRNAHLHIKLFIVPKNSNRSSKVLTGISFGEKEWIFRRHSNLFTLILQPREACSNWTVQYYNNI